MADSDSTAKEGSDLRKAIADRESYAPETFKMLLAYRTELQDDTKELAELGMMLERPSALKVDRAEDYKNRPDLFPGAASLDAAALNATTTSISASATSDVRSSSSATSYPSASYPRVSSQSVVPYAGPAQQYSSWNSKASSGFVGLSNQGATCYMNSLLQSLFMTPEFRHAIYNWSFDDCVEAEWERRSAPKEGVAAEQAVTPGKVEPKNIEEFKAQREKKSIPRQLQKLFAHLQLSDSRAIDTKSLTKSFGWTDADAFTQHDVQELCRVLFDALEKAFKGTKQENLINQLYEGTMKDYVKCMECGYESARSDKYLDIPCVIRPFGANKSFGSIEESLRNFVDPEKLTGSEQYFCEKCQKKVDAEKGLAYTSFPYLLMLQLKRFDFDYDTMRRIKLNSRVSFPQVLNLNRFLSTYTPPAEGENDAEEHDDTEDEPEEGHDDNQSGATSNKTKSTGDIEGNSSTSDPAPETGDSSESKGEDEDEDTKAKKEQINSVEASDKPKPKSKSRLHREKQIAAALKEGPYVYELYAILIHRGSALGGHYYAYIKQLDDDEWFEFNDSSVSNIDEKTIADAYGEDNARWGSGSNAYMLCYRRVDATRNMKIIAKEDIPSDVKAIVLEEEKEKLERNKQLERERAMVKFKLHYAHQTKGIKIHRGQTLNDVVVAAQKAFGLEETVAIEDLRLRGWSTYNDVPTDPLPDLSKTIEDMGWYTNKSLTLESRQAGTKWSIYDPRMWLLRVYVYDATTSTWNNEPYDVFVDKGARLNELRKILEEQFKIPFDQQVLVREDWSHEGIVIDLAKDEEIETIKMTEGMSLWLEPQLSGAANDSNAHQRDAAETAGSDAKTADAEAGPSAESEPEAAKEEPLAFQHIKDINNRLTVKFNHPDATKKTYTVTANKLMSLLELKEKIAAAIDLSLDEFLVLKGWGNYWNELNNESQLLKSYGMSGVVKVQIKKGKPTRHGEIPTKFLQFAIPNTSNEEELAKYEVLPILFELLVPEQTTIADIKKLVSENLKSQKQIEADPSLIRVRESLHRQAASIYTDSMTLKECTRSVGASGAALAVQILTAPEVKEQKKNEVLMLQRYRPELCKFDRAEEFAFSHDTTMSDIAKFISEHYAVEKVSVYGCYNFRQPDLVEIGGVQWDAKLDNSIKVCFLTDGDFIFWKDASAADKELSAEEKDTLKKSEAKRFAKYETTSSYRSSERERGLKIKQEDDQ